MFFKGYIDKEEAICRSTNPAKMEKLLASSKQTDAAQQLESARSS